MIDFIVGVIALAYFLLISAATKQHFVSGKYAAGMCVISVLSLIGIFTFLIHAFVTGLNLPVVVLALILAAFLLFGWSIKHSRQTRLALAFDPDSKTSGIITNGPWKYTRHPFYFSYCAFWFACALGTAHISSIAVFSTLLLVYCYSAIKEETELQKGSFGDEYKNYQKKVGFIWPKLLVKN